MHVTNALDDLNASALDKTDSELYGKLYDSLSAAYKAARLSTAGEVQALKAELETLQANQAATASAASAASSSAPSATVDNNHVDCRTQLEAVQAQLRGAQEIVGSSVVSHSVST